MTCAVKTLLHWVLPSLPFNLTLYNIKYSVKIQGSASNVGLKVMGGSLHRTLTGRRSREADWGRSRSQHGTSSTPNLEPSSKSSLNYTPAAREAELARSRGWKEGEKRDSGEAGGDTGGGTGGESGGEKGNGTTRKRYRISPTVMNLDSPGSDIGPGKQVEVHTRAHTRTASSLFFR